MMGSINNQKLISSISVISCLIFFAAHIVYFLFFLLIGVKPLIFFNIGSICFYVIMYLLIRYKFYSAYVILTGLEIAIYMSFGTMVVGTNAGFYICLIGMCTLIYFAGYFSSFGKNRIKPLYFSIFYGLLFLFTYLWLQFNDPIHPIENKYEIILFVTHTIIVFGFVITFLAILTRFTVSLERTIIKESETDRLTNVPNRNGLLNYYNRIDGQRDNYVVSIFDIDDFKKFNDRNGHLCGDYVLKEIARIATENSADDFVSRWGGEEFVIISKIEDNMDKTIEKIDRIRSSIDEYTFEYNTRKLKSSVTIGVAEYNNDETLEAWIKRADKKLYDGKLNGKNRTVI
ncbi:MAG: diguanylate cyclase [Acholeplasmatales bacterium]|nr:diguanylate cyclase [Acholeplasmatales bacterium]